MVKKRRCLLAWLLLAGGCLMVSGVAGSGRKERLQSTVEPVHASDLYSPPDHQEAASTSDHHGACCSRHHKLAAIGFGLSGEAVQVDVGRCRRTCKRPHLDTVTLLNPGGSDLKQQEHDFAQACPSHHVCSATETHMQRVSTMRGVEEMPVVAKCACAAKPSRCSRQPHHVTLFAGTPYEKRINVGACAGHCNHELGCRALRNETVSVAGPNGAQLQTVVRECGCAAGCYRAAHKETVYDYSEGEHNTNAPVVKDIDVGQCLGHCESGQEWKCVFRDRQDSSRCLAGLYSGRRANCSASHFELHRYTTRERQVREIIAITECRCS